MLGDRGMSSDESEGEIGTRRPYHVKVLRWRSSILTAWLHAIDKHSLTNSAGHTLSRRGICRDRFLSFKYSNRPPPTGLPAAFYDPDWLAKQDDRTRAKLRIKEGGDFPFPSK